MAYREFRQAAFPEERQVQPLDYTILQQKVLAQQEARAKKEVQDEIDRKKAFDELTVGDAEKVDEEFVKRNYVSPFVDRIKLKKHSGQQVDFEDIKERGRIDNLLAKSKTDAAKMQNAKDEIAKMPEWINKADQSDILMQKYMGKDVNLENRNMDSTLEDIDPKKNTNLFNNPVFTQKYLDTLKEKKLSEKEQRERGDITTSEGTTISSTFPIKRRSDGSFYMNPKDRDKVIAEYLSFGGNNGGAILYNKYMNEADSQLRREAEQHAAQQRLAGRNVDVEQIYNDFKNNPELNPYNKKKVADRISDMAESDLLLHAKADYNYDFSKLYDEPDAADKTRGRLQQLVQPTQSVSRGSTDTQRGKVINNETAGFNLKSIRGNNVVDGQMLKVNPKNIFFSDKGLKAAIGNTSSVDVDARHLGYGIVTPSGNPVLGTLTKKLSDIGNIKNKEDLRKFIFSPIVTGTIVDKAVVENDAPDQEIGTASQATQSRRSRGDKGTKITQANRTITFIPDERTFDAMKTATQGNVDFQQKFYSEKPAEASQLENAMRQKAKQIYGRDMKFEPISKQDLNAIISEYKKLDQYKDLDPKKLERAYILNQEKEGIILQPTEF
ncbi:hypothetical protein QNI16_23565 [Cytophagaceae bacterium YF14B1]|uniref:Uncharacterized protein n=1 Tax=Xanthocytophaga flava TaxID=3048013 RepID=A0AAE3U9A9_9BACT|nr:hypothetical protein [Xanthocytophaga flavus]MDJ1483497.1 hypothetical protein [Xanthocytophaga flavus]